MCPYDEVLEALRSSDTEKPDLTGPTTGTWPPRVPERNIQNVIEQTDTRTTFRCKKNVIRRTLTQLENVGHNGLDRQSLPVATICVLMMMFWRCSARAVLQNQTWQDARRKRDLQGSQKNHLKHHWKTDTCTNFRCSKNMIKFTIPQLENVGHNSSDRQSLLVATICVLMMKF